MTGFFDATTSFGSSPAKRADWSLSTLLAILEEHGVERALTLSLRGKYYDYASGNDETLAACRENRILLPVATIDPRRYLGCLEEVARCADAGFVAFRFFPDHQGWSLDWLPFLEVCEAIARVGLPIILPASAGGAITLAGRLLAPEAFVAQDYGMFGGAITPAGRLLAPLGVRVLFLGVGYGDMAEALAALRTYPMFYFDTHLLNTPEALEVLCRGGGEEQIVFGSNAPERYFESALNMLRSAELTPDQRQAVSGGNLRRFLGEGGSVWV